MKMWQTTRLLLLLILGINTQLFTAATPDEGIAAAEGPAIIAAAKEVSSESNSHPAGDDGTPPIAIMILAMARSGSTLMGQLFRHNEVGGWHICYERLDPAGSCR